MAFGQQSGPPATHRQMQDLLELVTGAGHEDLRDARGPLGLTQRQANGKFTRDEADALIEQLQAEADVAAAAADAVAEVAPDEGEAGEAGSATAAATASTAKANRSGARASASSGTTRQAAPRPKTAPGGAVAAARARREAEAAKALREASDELLAAELQRRGWVVMEP